MLVVVEDVVAVVEKQDRMDNNVRKNTTILPNDLLLSKEIDLFVVEFVVMSLNRYNLVNIYNYLSSSYFDYFDVMVFGVVVFVVDQ